MIGQLWLPILVATVLCFIGSALVWMLAPHHKKEWGPPPDQSGLMDVLRKQNIAAGNYMFPFADRSAGKTAFEESMKQWAEGPAGVLYIFPRGKMNMGAMMGRQFAFFLVVNTMVALIARAAMFNDTMIYMHVFKVTGTIAFMANGLGVVPESIWFGRPWKRTWLTLVDALLYAGLTAGAFGWLWPR